MVLRFEPCNDQVIAARLEIEFGQLVAGRIDQDRSAVTDQVSAGAELLW